MGQLLALSVLIVNGPYRCSSQDSISLAVPAWSRELVATNIFLVGSSSLANGALCFQRSCAQEPIRSWLREDLAELVPRLLQFLGPLARVDHRPISVVTFRKTSIISSKHVVHSFVSQFDTQKRGSVCWHSSCQCWTETGEECFDSSLSINFSYCASYSRISSCTL